MQFSTRANNEMDLECIRQFLAQLVLKTYFKDTVTLIKLGTPSSLTWRRSSASSRTSSMASEDASLRTFMFATMTKVRIRDLMPRHNRCPTLSALRLPVASQFWERKDLKHGTSMKWPVISLRTQSTLDPLKIHSTCSNTISRRRHLSQYASCSVPNTTRCKNWALKKSRNAIESSRCSVSTTIAPPTSTGQDRAIRRTVPTKWTFSRIPRSPLTMKTSRANQTLRPESSLFRRGLEVPRVKVSNSRFLTTSWPLSVSVSSMTILVAQSRWTTCRPSTSPALKSVTSTSITGTLIFKCRNSMRTQNSCKASTTSSPTHPQATSSNCGFRRMATPSQKTSIVKLKYTARSWAKKRKRSKKKKKRRRKQRIREIETSSRISELVSA